MNESRGGRGGGSGVGWSTDSNETTLWTTRCVRVFTGRHVRRAREGHGRAAASYGATAVGE